MVTLFLLASWVSSTLSLSILWQDSSSAVHEGMPVYVQTAPNVIVPVGTVESLIPTEAGMQTLFSYDRQAEAILRKGALASLRKVPGEEDRAIVLINTIQDAAPVSEGDVLYGAVPLSSSLNPGLSAEILVRDWKLTAVLLLGFVIFIVILAHFTRMIFRMVVFVICTGGGAMGAVFLPEHVHTILGRLLPAASMERLRLDVIAYVVAFLLGYIAVLGLVMLILAPLRGRNKKKGK